jgi:amicyanin
MSGKLYKVLIFSLVVSALLAVNIGCGSYSSAPAAPANSSAGAPAAAPAGAVEVKIAGFAFQPAEVTIKAGQSVTWTNDDSAPHTATGKGFDSGSLSKGQKFTFQFASAGSFDYICTFHPNMKGKVIVQ